MMNTTENQSETSRMRARMLEQVAKLEAECDLLHAGMNTILTSKAIRVFSETETNKINQYREDIAENREEYGQYKVTLEEYQSPVFQSAYKEAMEKMKPIALETEPTQAPKLTLSQRVEQLRANNMSPKEMAEAIRSEYGTPTNVENKQQKPSAKDALGVIRDANLSQEEKRRQLLELAYAKVHDKNGYSVVPEKTPPVPANTSRTPSLR